MNLLLAALVAGTFFLTIERMGLVDRGRDVFIRAQNCIDLLRNPSLDDRAKEGALRSHAVHLFGLFALITGGSLVSLSVPLAGVWILEQAGMATVDEVLSVLGRIDFLVGTMLVGTIFFLRADRAGPR